ncbi:hypothetical protein AVEN_159478-1 [Araneus ventricosus]|uniref:Tc1-like transposase DDE domain-containing protein n=1 Tax=Araneus ventricosus TaxID=182803 RepID=A0A4Y2A157_ARAVE|nr:hypothetical protein AVEN_159478-1 [Araneus ventricosus]
MGTDESTFSREGMFNSHNFPVWSEENPYATRIRAAEEQFSINVWAGIVGDHLAGPYLLPERLTGANYLIFLQQVLPQLLDDAHLSAAMRSSVWFQHDGASAHYSIEASPPECNVWPTVDRAGWSSALARSIARPHLS